MGRCSQFELVGDEGFFIHEDISVFIGIGTTDKTDLNRQGRIVEVFLAVYFDEPDQFVTLCLRPQIDLTTFQAGINKGHKSRTRPDAGLVGRLSPEQLEQGA